MQINAFGNIKSILVLQMRYLGDAVINSYFIRILHQSFPDVKIDSLGRMALEPVVRRLCDVNDYVTIDIPMLRSHPISTRGILEFIPKLYKIRAARYDLCINLVGDVRENFIGRLTNPHVNIAPFWSEQHPFRRLIHRPKGKMFLDVGIDIPDDMLNIYAVIDHIAEMLGSEVDIAINDTIQKKIGLAPVVKQPVIGIHPGASQPWKRWTFDKWRVGIDMFIGRGYGIVIFGSPAESKALMQEFDTQLKNPLVSVVVGSINGFIDVLEKVDFLVGMDSFSIHVANALGIPAVMLNGANNSLIFAPPKTPVLSAGTRCPHYPCYNQPKCEGSDLEYVCVRGIKVLDVVAAVERRLMAL